MQIREIEHTDYENLSALAIQVWLNTYAKTGIRDKISHYVLREFSPQQFMKFHKSHDYALYLAFQAHHLVGFITINLVSKFENSERYGNEIKTLYVHHLFQKQGIGKLLVNAAQKACGDTLWLTTWVHNESAISFYKHIGFEHVGLADFNLSGESHTNYVFSNNSTVQQLST
ncbi:GNAT family N-acetyltransferase [Desulfosediminicola flagellatus]|uniref:GNAT family N-acetyltransferase n=1 Tax=Desulfosediminicola flagellatus TaxID=2569541 RepID=UPI0010AC7A77|nr:N-acetyltransferase [Desulfosediminicola flagellatus]